MSHVRQRKEPLPFVTSSVLLMTGGAAWLAAAIRRRQPSGDVIAVHAPVGALAVAEAFAGAMKEI